MSRNAGARRPARWSIGAVSLAALCASAGCSAILGVEDAILISAQSGGSAGAAQGGTAGSGASSGAAGKGTAGSEVGGAGGTAGAVLNGANEAAVAGFLEGQLAYHEIVPACRSVLGEHNFESQPSLDRLLELDRWARQEVTRWA